MHRKKQEKKLEEEEWQELSTAPIALWAKLLRKWEIGKFNKITS